MDFFENLETKWYKIERLILIWLSKVIPMARSMLKRNKHACHESNVWPMSHISHGCGCPISYLKHIIYSNTIRGDDVCAAKNKNT